MFLPIGFLIAQLPLGLACFYTRNPEGEPVNWSDLQTWSFFEPFQSINFQDPFRARL